jgi:hypothetical protein
MVSILQKSYDGIHGVAGKFMEKGGIRKRAA